MNNEAAQFTERGYVIVRNFISEADASVISRYMEYALKSVLYTDRGDGIGPLSNSPSKYARYADPMMEVLLVNSLISVWPVARIEARTWDRFETATRVRKWLHVLADPSV